MTQATMDLVGEVHCLNCGRTLAEALRRPGSSRVQLHPAAGQAAIQVATRGERELECLRCHGRAFLEPVLLDGFSLRIRRDVATRAD